MKLEEKALLIELLQEKRDLVRFNRLKVFEPYVYQKTYINASSDYTTRFMKAGNRVGKSEAAAYEATVHATGDYPAWWTGRRFDHPVRILCAGVSNTTVRDIMQSKLIGEPTDRSGWGSGMIPKDRLGVTARKAGIPDALSSVLVKHKTGGWSKITFVSYEAGKEAFMGTSMHYVNLDEEPPMDIYSQSVRAVTDTDGLISITATPENGMTELMAKFLDEKKTTGYIQEVTWDDCPHLTKDVQEKMLAELPAHERDMRSKGMVTLGSGLIYPIDTEAVACEPFDIPTHWPRIAGIDFGYEHDAAWVAAAWDREEDIIYVTDCYKVRHATPDKQVHAIQSRGGRDIPTAWPQDGLTAEKGSGIMLKSLYEGLYFLPDSFKNPADPITGKANNSVEAGIQTLLQRMQNGKMRVFQHLEDVFSDLRMYHRKDGKIVKKFDDVADAMRYACMSINHAQCPNYSYKPYVPHEHEDAYANDIVAY